MRNYVKEQAHDDICITDLYWDRIYLHIRLTGSDLEHQAFAIASNKNKFSFPVEYDPAAGEIVINITNIGNKKMLTNGKWYLKYLNQAYDYEMIFYREDLQAYKTAVAQLPVGAEEPEKPWPPFRWKNIPLTLECSYQLRNLDRIYRYTGVSYAYVVSFQTQVRRDELIAAMEVTFMVKNKQPLKRYFRVEANGRLNAVKRWGVYVLQQFLNRYYHFCARLSPKKGDRILLMSETRDMGGNLKALDDRLKERGLDKQFRLSYFFVKTPDISRKKVLFVWMKLARLAAKQDYIFVDDYVPFFDYVDPVEETTLTQVWHAGVGYKSVGFARFGEKGSPRPFHACHRKYDYAVVGGEALRDVYAEVFGIDRSCCLPFGLMRNDGYLDQEKIDAFRERFYGEHPEFAGKKIIMFAPTFRGTGQKEANYPYELLDQQKLYEMCGEEYIFMVKMHPFIREKMVIEERYADRIVDYSAYPDINELFYVTQILITDYSSNIYEFSMHHRPIISFAYDKNEYELIRSVHRTLDRYAPGKVCTTLDEVIETIRTGDFEIEKLEAFVRDNVDESDGRAADRVIDYILLHQAVPFGEEKHGTPAPAAAEPPAPQCPVSQIAEDRGVDLRPGSVLQIGGGSRLRPAAGSVVKLAEGSELTLTKGAVVVLTEGSTVTLSGTAAVTALREAVESLPPERREALLENGGEKAFADALARALRSALKETMDDRKN